MRGFQSWIVKEAVDGRPSCGGEGERPDGGECDGAYSHMIYKEAQSCGCVGEVGEGRVLRSGRRGQAPSTPPPRSRLRLVPRAIPIRRFPSSAIQTPRRCRRPPPAPSGLISASPASSPTSPRVIVYPAPPGQRLGPCNCRAHAPLSPSRRQQTPLPSPPSPSPSPPLPSKPLPPAPSPPPAPLHPIPQAAPVPPPSPQDPPPTRTCSVTCFVLSLLMRLVLTQTNSPPPRRLLWSS